MKLLILVQWYPPDLRVPARRWGYLVSAMQKQGVNCTVISAGDGSHNEYVGDYGERVIRLNISNRNQDKIPQALMIRANPTFQERLLGFFFRVLPPAYRNLSTKSWLNQSDSFPELIDLAEKADYIISSYGPMGPFLLGRWLSKRTKKPWITDIRDSFESKGIKKVSIIQRKLNRAIEKYLLRHAHLRITIGVTLAEYLSQKYNAKFNAIYNGWTDEDRVDRRLNEKCNKPYVYYAGSIYIHRMSALQIVLDGLVKYPEIYLKIRLLTDYTQDEFASLLNRKEYTNKVELLPKAESKIVKAELAGSLCALVLEDISNESSLTNGTVTGKLFGLLASGVPGIAVSSESGEIRYLVNKIEGWYGVNSVEQFLGALEELIKYPNLVVNNSELSDYKIEEQSKKLIELIQNTQ